LPTVTGGDHDRQHNRIRRIWAGFRRYRRRHLVADVRRELVAGEAKGRRTAFGRPRASSARSGRATWSLLATRQRHRTGRSTRYDYAVEGQSYSGDRFALEFNSWYPDEASAVAAAARFRPGQPVAVWYDADSPVTAVLDRTPPSRRIYYRNFALVAAGVAVVAAVAAVVVIASLR